MKDSHVNSQITEINSVPEVTSRGGRIKVYASPKTIGTSRLIMGSAHLRPGEKINKHLHDYGEEVILVEKGEGVVTIDDQEYPVKAGHIMVAKQGQSHEVLNNGAYDMELRFASAPLAPTQAEGHRDLK
jgi:quercetin dioxygenase-like cupin family protein